MIKKYFGLLAVLSLFAQASVCAGLDLDKVRKASAGHSLIVQSGQSKKQVLDFINSAAKTLDLVIYEMDDPDIISAMLKARGRGVVVRVIFDVRSKHFIPNPNPQTMKVFSVGGIAVKEAAPALFPITHQKTFIADKARALVMTFNLSPAYFGGTRDFGLITWNPDEVSEITKTFDADWAGRAAKHDSAALVWSPDNARSKITDLINSAGKTIEIYNLEVKDKGILSALAAAVKERKVTVRFIMAQLMTDGQNVNGAGAKILADAGILIKPMVNPFVHGKMVMADGGVVFIGSQNFSASSLDRNRELGVITANPLIVQQVRGVFDADWRTLK